jgi:hypothetical protein
LAKKRNLLREAFEQAAGPDVDVCPTCLGPNPQAPGVILVNLATIQFCPTCELLVNERGLSCACRWGNNVFCTVLVITDRPPVPRETHRELMARIGVCQERWEAMSGAPKIR